MPELLTTTVGGEQRMLFNKYRIFLLPDWNFLQDDSVLILLGRKDENYVESLLFEWVMDRDDQLLWLAMQKDALSSNPEQKKRLKQKFLNANIPTTQGEQVESIKELDLHTISVYIVKSTYERMGWFGYRYRVLCFPQKDWKQDFFYCEHAIHTVDENRIPVEVAGLTTELVCGISNVHVDADRIDK